MCHMTVTARPHAGGTSVARAGVFHIRLAPFGTASPTPTVRAVDPADCSSVGTIPDIGRCRSRCPLIVIRAEGVIRT